VYYVQADARLDILVTTASRQVAHHVPVTAADLNRKINAFRRTLRNPAANPKVMGRELYQLLIAPIAADLVQAGARTLMLSLDGTLRYIPFSALYDGTRYLIESYGIAMYTEVARENLTLRPDSRRLIAGLGLTRAIGDFKPLPSVKAELEGIVKHGDKGLIPGELHLDREFNLEQIRRTLAGPYPLLHIASHFVFRPGIESNSFLLLGDGEHLTLNRIKADHLDFSHLDLITLSACETGLGGGHNARGQEIEGFGTLVQKQGAKGVIATLWPVADASTGLLMQQFYLRRQRDALTKAEALREAQLALVLGLGVNPGRESATQPLKRAGGSAGPYAHPFFWAPFILMGNWL